MEEKYLLVIDTEDYAGNFEREMCAYITGRVGECGVGSEEADVFREEVEEKIVEWFDDNVEDVSDEHGVFRPVKLSPTPGWFNDGVGNHYKETDYDTSMAIRKYNETQQRWKSQHGETSSFKLMRSVNDIVRYPAYLSIEIMFYQKPSDSLIEFMTNRAHKFCEKYGNPKEIVAVRLIKRVTEDVELFRK